MIFFCISSATIQKNSSNLDRIDADSTSPILVMGSVMGLFQFHNGVLLMTAIKETPFANGGMNTS